MLIFNHMITSIRILIKYYCLEDIKMYIIIIINKHSYKITIGKIKKI